MAHAASHQRGEVAVTSHMKIGLDHHYRLPQVQITRRPRPPHDDRSPACLRLPSPSTTVPPVRPYLRTLARLVLSTFASYLQLCLNSSSIHRSTSSVLEYQPTFFISGKQTNKQDANGFSPIPDAAEQQ